jgi:hypothetical protein
VGRRDGRVGRGVGNLGLLVLVQILADLVYRSDMMGKTGDAKYSYTQSSACPRSSDDLEPPKTQSRDSTHIDQVRNRSLRSSL